MSLLPLKTSINTKQLAFVPYFSTAKLNASSISTGDITANTAQISSIVAEYISSVSLDSEYINTSTINTLHVDLDGQILTANANELLLNGVPIATQSSLSTIGDWALFPAVSTIQAAGNDLDQGGTLSSLNIRAGNGFFLNLIAYNSLFVSTNTSTISSLVETAELGQFSTLTSGTISSGQISCSSLDAPLATISSVVGDSANFSTISCMSLSSLMGSISSLATDEIFVSSLTTDVMSTNALAVSSINGAEFTSTTINVQVVGVSSLVSNAISSVGAEIRSALVSTIQFKPSFDLGLNFDTASLGNALQGGLTRVAVGVGAGTAIIGTGLIASAFSRPSATSVNANAYYQYATPTQLQFSTLGADTSTFTRLVSSSGAGNEIPGVELVLSSIISSGTLCVRSLGDPINLADPSTFTSSIQSFGEWVAVPPETLQVLSSFATASVSSLEVSSINNAAYPPPAVIPEDWANYPAISSINFSTGVAAVVAASAGSDIAIEGASVKLIGAYTDAEDLLLVSSLSTATLLGSNNNLFGLGLPGLKIDAPNLFLSSVQTTIAGLTNVSSLGAVNVSARNGGISSLQVSSLAFAQTGAFGLSSLMWLSTSQIPGTGTSTTTYMNTDLSLLQNDLYCQQLRVGYANTGGSALSEIIMYAPTTGGTSISFNVGNNDRTARIQSTQNAGFGGYILDTSLNPPFFSTINNTSTAMIAYFPSTTASSIGYSTLSIIPVSFQTTSAFSGTLLYPNISSSAVAANIVASTTILTNAAGSYVIAQANTSFLNTTNQYHDIYLNIAIDGVMSPSTFTSLPAGVNHYANGSIAFRQAVSSGTHTLVLYASADANGVAVGSQVDIWGTGNLAP